MKAEGLSLSVLLGMENPLELDLVEQLNNGSALHCNDSPYVLVEFPYRQLPIYWEEALFNLQLGGKRPIIAHPERQTQIQENPELLAGVVRRGVMTQITAGSLSRRSGSLVRKTAETLVKNGLAHVIASDAHGPTGPRNTSLLEGFCGGLEAGGHRNGYQDDDRGPTINGPARGRSAVLNWLPFLGHDQVAGFYGSRMAAGSAAEPPTHNRANLLQRWVKPNGLSRLARPGKPRSF